MDNPQRYQPLSHALHPTNYIHPIYPGQQQQQHQQPPQQHHHQDDSNDVDDDNDSSSSPAQPTTTKRKPGRPRGSKNRKPRAAPGTSQKYLQAHPQEPNQPSSSTAPPEVNAQNHQYYEFQWRMLTLCSEFYGAAEELVRGAPPLVIAQCYQMGPTAKVDPLNLLAEAKRICDDLLRNPQKLITQPPPPMIPAIPSYYQHAYTQSVLSPTVSTPSTTTVISNPSSFAVPLAQGYYQYQPPQASASTAPATTGSSSNQGTWSDDESEKLRKLAEASRNSSGDIDWDAVVAQWGHGRTRHQILIKATAMGLKESSSGPSATATHAKPSKRRREEEDENVSQSTSGQPPSSSSKTPPQPPSTQTSPTLHHPQPPPPTQPSPALHHPLPPQQPSPALHHAQPPPVPNKGLPWPMPTVAVNSSSPVLEDRGLPGYYRPRFIYTQRKDDA